MINIMLIRKYTDIVHRDGHVWVEAAMASGNATVLNHASDCEDSLELLQLLWLWKSPRIITIIMIIPYNIILS